jgi:hypothetical protein
LFIDEREKFRESLAENSPHQRSCQRSQEVPSFKETRVGPLKDSRSLRMSLY